ncbi:unnamed protein product [Choristocarpus tenellus]
MHGDFHTKEQSKIPFFLVPWSSTSVSAMGGGESGGEQAVPSKGLPPNMRYTAPAQMRVCKVIAYVLSHDECSQHLERRVSRNDEGAGEGSSKRAPEDTVEVLCGDRVVEAHLYLGEEDRGDLLFGLRRLS